MVQIRQRRVFFVEGYEPQGADGFYRMFRREWNRFRANWRVSGSLGGMTIESDDIAFWDIETSGPNWRVNTRYEFLRLEGYIAHNLAQSRSTQLGRAVRWIVDDLASGALWRAFRASWRMGVLIVYSQTVLLLWAGLAIAGGWSIARAVAGAESAALFSVIVAAVAFLIFAMLRPLVDAMFVNQLNNCWPYLREFARGEPTGFDRSLTLLAERIVNAANGGEVDEILIVGHSAGAMLALTAMQQALARDPDLGIKRAQVCVMTVGSIMPALALHPRATRLRDTIRFMSTERSVLWADCQSKEDFMNFSDFDPVSGVGIEAGPVRCNPLVWPVRFRDLIAPDVFRKARFNYWRMHYQYLMSNDRRAAYDYYMFVCGPAPLALWASRDATARDAFADDGTYQVVRLKAAE